MKHTPVYKERQAAGWANNPPHTHPCSLPHHSLGHWVYFTQGPICKTTSHRVFGDRRVSQMSRPCVESCVFWSLTAILRVAPPRTGFWLQFPLLSWEPLNTYFPVSSVGLSWVNPNCFWRSKQVRLGDKTKVERNTVRQEGLQKVFPVANIVLCSLYLRAPQSADEQAEELCAVSVCLRQSERTQQKGLFIHDG